MFYQLHPTKIGKVMASPMAAELNLLVYSQVVKKTELYHNHKNIVVSTVCLPMDHNFLGRLSFPKIFETIVFRNDEFDNELVRYPTYKSALEHHNLIVERLKNNEELPPYVLPSDWIKDYADQFDYEDDEV